jgi:glycosyltransferase involved in cell wall biosynthesis
MTRVLVLSEFFLPAFRAGGPVRTLANLVERLDSDIEFSIVAGDRDLGDHDPLPGVDTGVWTSRGGHRVIYVRGLVRLARILRTERYDVLYVNSLFSRRFGIAPVVLRRLRLAPRRPIVLAPRGELSPGALGINVRRKRAFLRLAKAIGFYRSARWQASSPFEAAEIQTWFGQDVDVEIVPSLLTAPTESPNTPTQQKEPGRLRIVFFARVAKIKNLLGALELVDGVNGDIRFDLFGPIEDNDYWARCQLRIADLPPNISVRHRGPIPFGEVVTALANYDALLLPTLGENFGHAITEALAAGCPVIISDRTPWRKLEARGVGWDIPLSEPDRFRTVLVRLVAMNHEEHRRWSDAARAYAAKLAADPGTLDANRRLFTT